MELLSDGGRAVELSGGIEQAPKRRVIQRTMYQKHFIYFYPFSVLKQLISSVCTSLVIRVIWLYSVLSSG